MPNQAGISRSPSLTVSQIGCGGVNLSAPARQIWQIFVFEETMPNQIQNLNAILNDNFQIIYERGLQVNNLTSLYFLYNTIFRLEPIIDIYE